MVLAKGRANRAAALKEASPMALNVFAPRCFAVALIALASLNVLACGGADDSGTPGVEQDVTAKAGRFETFKGKDGQHYFHLLAANGQKVLQSEGYTTLTSAKKGISSVKSNGVDAEAYEVLEASSGEFYFNLIAGNGEIIGTSQMYATKTTANRGVTTVVGLVSRANREEAAATGGAKFQAFKGLDSKQYFHLRAANGEIVLQSEGYSSSSAALKGITSVRSNGKLAEQYEIVEAENGQFFFRLLATNGEPIAYGETYVSLANAERAVDAIVVLLRSEKVADPQ
jgi:uncharacterized protein